MWWFITQRIRRGSRRRSAMFSQSTIALNTAAFAICPLIGRSSTWGQERNAFISSARSSSTRAMNRVPW